LTVIRTRLRDTSETEKRLMTFKTCAAAIVSAGAIACMTTTAFPADPHGVWISADRDTRA
jgi:hypothetical protein